MDVVVVTESRFQQVPDGSVFCQDGTYGYGFWRRYLTGFERVIVLARCSNASRAEGIPVNGPAVEVWPLPDSYGAAGAIRQWRRWRRIVSLLAATNRAWILRVPGQVGALAASTLWRRGLPFAVEVVGDPAAVFAAGNFRHPLRPVLRLLFRHLLRAACRHASAAAYVTRTYLQVHYPASSQAYVTDYSSAELPPLAFRAAPRDFDRTIPARHVINVATMSQQYKGQHLLIDAVAHCARMGYPLTLTLIGDGRYRRDLELQVASRGLQQHVHFLGRLPAGVPVWSALDQADLFVLPSLTEGLPRALIEAQARALPCLATAVGGVPELVEPTELVSPGDARSLAQAILDVLNDTERMTRLSHENWFRAQRYSEAALRQRRDEFYASVRDRMSRTVDISARKVAA
jgi:glycosyltransferase involved in cell wall biosynthesis